MIYSTEFKESVIQKVLTGDRPQHEGSDRPRLRPPGAPEGRGLYRSDFHAMNPGDGEGLKAEIRFIRDYVKEQFYVINFISNEVTSLLTITAGGGSQ